MTKGPKTKLELIKGSRVSIKAEDLKKSPMKAQRACSSLIKGDEQENGFLGRETTTISKGRLSDVQTDQKREAF
jgi:hypothetical protein